MTAGIEAGGGRRLLSRFRELRLERVRQRQERFSPAFDQPASSNSSESDDDDWSVEAERGVNALAPTQTKGTPANQLQRRLLEDKIIFRFYHGGNLTKTLTLSRDERLLNGTDCTPDQRFAIIVHGWHENCYEVPWVQDLRQNLHTYRGGCITCMDYSAFSSGSYRGLLGRFRDIRDVLLRLVQKLRYEGVEYGRIFMYGFSFGAQLALDVGNQIGASELEAIDTCDMAGPGFDGERTFRQGDFRSAAKNVQCIHTSIDKGTRFPNKCHQNWRMGLCGMRQAAAGPPPLGSHGLCPVFYNLAFRYQFVAQPKPPECLALGDTATYPRNYRMGYVEDRKSEVRGELYALTSDAYPYTVYTNPYNFFEYF
ncbi:uncharacterized protein LOC128278706 [Anopheles cruzii]|uniref:uncharacterized protein LOC128278706 n=1 Tax=Anopheles cruzii TaxID=68878 RepID=UPI0022EC7E08|nr:uncharacterized protein LOC128278706 [Anopheles cruzii]